MIELKMGRTLTTPTKVGRILTRGLRSSKERLLLDFLPGVVCQPLFFGPSINLEHLDLWPKLSRLLPFF